MAQRTQQDPLLKARLIFFKEKKGSISNLKIAHSQSIGHQTSLFICRSKSDSGDSFYLSLFSTLSTIVTDWNMKFLSVDPNIYKKKLTPFS